MARALVRKNGVKTTVDFTTIRDSFSTKLVGCSNADIEAVVLLAHNHRPRRPHRSHRRPLHTRRRRLLPQRDTELLESIELLAVFEAASRRLLPA